MGAITKKERFYKKLLSEYSYQYLYVNRMKNPKVSSEDKQIIALRIACADISTNQKHELSGAVSLLSLVQAVKGMP